MVTKPHDGSIAVGEAGHLCCGAMRNDRLLVALAVVVAIALIVIAVLYWAEPAKSLPGFFPGHEAGSNHHHVKHGIAAFLVGLACLVFAWFRSGPKRAATP
jgi:hypothetical protein